MAQRISITRIVSWMQIGLHSSRNYVTKTYLSYHRAPASHVGCAQRQIWFSFSSLWAKPTSKRPCHRHFNCVDCRKEPGMASPVIFENVQSNVKWQLSGEKTPAQRWSAAWPASATLVKRLTSVAALQLAVDKSSGPFSGMHRLEILLPSVQKASLHYHSFSLTCQTFLFVVRYMIDRG